MPGMSENYYGSVVRIRVKPGKMDDLIRTFKAQGVGPSAVSHTVLRSDDDPNVVWVAGVHRSREAFRANSDTPEQQARFRELSQYFEDAPPEWHDGDVVHFATH